MTDHADDTIHIQSGVTENGTAVCTLQWGHLTRLVPPDDILNTARELAAAAQAAEVDIALIKTLREDIDAPDAMLAAVLGRVREARPAPAGRIVLRIEAVAGYHTMQPYIHIGLGSMKGQLSPNEARQMAQHWTEAAIAAHTDVRLRYVLQGMDKLTAADIDDVFRQLLAVGGDHTRN